MRSNRRPLALAATCIPVLLGLGLVAGAQPASASTTGASSAGAASDCGTTSTNAEGILDADLLQACLLNQVASSLGTEVVAVEETAWTGEAEAPYDALDAVFAVEEEILPLVGPVETVVEEVAPDAGAWDAFAALRDCESGGDYGINTGNGYYGAYQFSLETWQSLGYGGYPHEASPAVQDQAAAELQSLYGWSQWPGCSWYLGLA